MSRGLTDEPIIEPNDEENQTHLDEIDAIIKELIKGQNKIHDRVVDLERIIDHMKATNTSPLLPSEKKRRFRGL